MSLIVGKPRLVGPVGFAVACDLAVNALKALTDPGGNGFHRLARSEAVGDLDAIVLVDVAGIDRARLRDAHAASIDKPQRPTAHRHAHPAGRFRPGHPRPNQLEVRLLDPHR